MIEIDARHLCAVIPISYVTYYQALDKFSSLRSLKQKPYVLAVPTSTDPSVGAAAQEKVCPAVTTGHQMPPCLLSNAGPSNWQNRQNVWKASKPKIEQDILLPIFHPITIDRPSSSNVDKCYKEMTECIKTDRERSYAPGKMMKSNGMSVAVYALTTKDNKLYPNGIPCWRALFGPYFALMTILDDNNGWCVYEVDIAARTLHVMDPMMTTSNEGSMERKHQKNAKYMLHCLCKCLREWYPNWHFSTFQWTYKYNYGMHPSCSRE
ncbi:uncharacterized protein LOC119275978 isoform X2 [Triticum dicoccoides]|uniref:uncharacterized protein LOC119275978 isoform X2 n=1 Tax=Triticum dicoccoides TaxID=85692 RepID=UPI00188E4343|nr:uncharacterized protein LOC119275978 isoform X2 [Triticum dicoccoides]